MKKINNIERTVIDLDGNKLVLCGIIKSDKELTARDIVKFINIQNRLEEQNKNNKTQMYIIKEILWYNFNRW